MGQTYTLQYSGQKIDTILSNSEEHIKDTDIHLTERDKANLDTQANWNETDINSKAYIQNKSTDIATKVYVSDQISAHNSAENSHPNLREIIKNKQDKLPTITNTDAGKILQVDAYGNWTVTVMPPATDYSVTLEELHTEDYAKTYELKQHGVSLGTINIPSDMVVSSGVVNTFDTAGEWGEAGTYLVLTLANTTNDKIYINVANLIEYVTSGSSPSDIVNINISLDHKITASISDNSIPKSKLEPSIQNTLTRADSLSNIPSGVIVIWSGSSLNIPNGWVLCDGNNNTPDLRDRFIIGAGNKYSIGNTGGEEEHTLTELEMPAHDHDFDRHQLWKNEQVPPSTTSTSNGYGLSWTTLPIYTDTTVATGGGESHNNMPPYYALCYIMKL